MSQGHAGNGGLQKHSIGETYPWTVIGTIDADGNTRYYVQNLVTGERPGDGSPHFYSCSIAHDTAQFIHDIRSKT
jgi:hypothetical protein